MLKVIRKIIQKILFKISRIIFWLTPHEYIKKNDLETKLKDNLADETFQNFREDFKKSSLIYSRDEIREYAIKTSLLNDKNNDFYYLEFGVFKGESANFFSKYVKKYYAFDNFQGYREDRANTSAVLRSRDDFNLQGKLPKLNSNVEPVVGWVEDTLEEFLKTHNPKINFVHLDINLYKSTKFVCKNQILKVCNSNTHFSKLYNENEEVNFPIAHHDGNYFVNNETKKMIYDNNQIAFKYHENNPNGSVDNIAGIYSQNHRILGLMPHPERRVSSEIGLDGERLFRSLNI